nr:hypothetical protein [Tanacetum cinerariifolium]
GRYTITQPKAPTDLKSQKNRIPPSSKPKYSYESLEASKSVEEQVNHPKTAEAKKSADDDAQITFLGSEPYHMKIDQTLKKVNSDEIDFGLQSMPDDELASLSGFEAEDSDDEGS